MHDLQHAFPGQKEGEPVYVFVRPYALAFVPTAAVFLLLFSLASLGQFGLAAGGSTFAGTVASQLAIVFLGLFQIFTLIVFLVAVLDFYYDVVIVTDRRVVDIDQEMLFYRRISELSLENVEDVNSVVKGILPTLFGYGTVDIQTAATVENFVMGNIRNPREITSIIVDLSEQAKNDIPPQKRIPGGQALAVINNRIITTEAELAAVGAILPVEFQRRRNAP
jgi:hypothetical protein